MVDPSKIGSGQEEQAVIDLFNAHEFPQIKCPYCPSFLQAIISEQDDRQIISLTCGCDKWEMLEEAVTLEKIETSANKCPHRYIRDHIFRDHCTKCGKPKEGP